MPSDVNGVNDVYEWEAPGTGSCASASQNGGFLFLISEGDSPDPSYFADSSEGGSDVFFLTAQSLVHQDQDELIDMYDARVGGGIPSLTEVEPPPTSCTDLSGCHLPAQPSPSLGSPGTSPFQGPPNQHKKLHKNKKKHKHHQHKKHKKHHQQKKHRRGNPAGGKQS